MSSLEIILCLIIALLVAGLFWLMRQKNSLFMDAIRWQERFAEMEKSQQNDRENLFLQKTELSQNREILFQQQKSLAVAEAEKNALINQLEFYRAEESKRMESTRSELELLSQRIFEEKTQKFTDLGKSAISDLVAPVRLELELLKKSLEENGKVDAVRENEIKHALTQVAAINQKLGSQAEGLAKALKGDNKLVGDYGEVILERILEFSGLRKNEHFILQGENLGLKSPENTHLKPDVIIRLPENRCIVVDSKMSLLSWANAQSQDELEREQSLSEFQKSIKAHINNLAEKPYTEALNNQGLVAIDYKFLFISIEAAFYTCLQRDSELYNFAFSKGIILTSPTTLLATLSTVKHTWKQYDIGKNAQEISHRASLMLDKWTDFVTDMEKIGNSLTMAQKNFSDAQNKLVQGHGNLLGQAEKLKNLGVKSKKELPKSFQKHVVGEVNSIGQENL